MLKIRGREALPASAAWNITKTLIETCFFWITFLYLFPYLIYLAEIKFELNKYYFSALPITGVVLFIWGAILSVSSGIIMAAIGKGTPLPIDCPRKLVIRGPYAYVRNPMAIGGLTQGAAIGLFLGSPFIVLYSLCGLLLWNFFVRYWEEEDLQERFGEEFTHYQQNVKCWFPRLSPYKR